MRNELCCMYGAGDAYSITWKIDENFVKDQWHILAMKYDGTSVSLFIDGDKKGSTSKTAIKNTPLYIGGMNGSGTTSAGLTWGWANGYYRNLAIYDGALTDEELANYSF